MRRDNFLPLRIEGKIVAYLLNEQTLKAQYDRGPSLPFLKLGKLNGSPKNVQLLQEIFIKKPKTLVT